MSELIERAREFAVRAHKRIDQTRKYTKLPYDVHLKAVAELVASVTDDEAMIAAAWLHDVIEDTPASYEEVAQAFGADVAQLVVELTDVSKPGDGNRAERKAIDRNHISAASPRAKTVKLADLTDNCMDICRHDSRFARVFLGEMRALMNVLNEGDSRLYARAEKAMIRCGQRLGIDVAADTGVSEPVVPGGAAGMQRRSLRIFVDAFTAKDIAEPLRSFDVDAPAAEVGEVLEEAGLSVAAVRRDGLVCGLVDRASLVAGRCGDHSRPLGAGQVVSADASLSDVIHVLTRFESCLLSVLGGVDAIVTRADVQKPVARMWLFGIVTLVEMGLTARIRETWADGSWHQNITGTRLAKAETLMNERRRRGQQCDLVDCLQLSDKAKILMRDEARLAEFGFSSASAAKQVAKELESLRNNLAHAQDIVTHDWAQIARLARRIEGLVSGTLLNQR